MEGSPMLRAEGLVKRFGDLTAVKQVTLEVNAGEVLGFLGPNGAGKTTSIKMMCGLLKPDGGRMLLNGRPITDKLEDRIQIGVCPQSLVLWARLTCLGQLTFIGQMYGLPEKEAKTRGETLLERLGLKEKRLVQASKLSGGMQRRLNIALALVHDPKVIFFDEPEAGLDPQSRVLVREFIKSLSSTKAVILTTHNMDEADRVATRVAIIDHGSILRLDTPSALKRQAGEGHVVEIDLGAAPDTARQNQIREKLAGVSTKVEFHNSSLVVLTARASQSLAKLLEALDALALGTHEVKLREPSLEDVFIQLTGRRLRE